MTVSVENFTPATMSQIDKTQPVAFDVVNSTGDGFVRLMVAVSYTVDGQEFAEIAHDGDQFRGDYKGYANARTPISEGFRFMLLRDGGWLADPTIEIFPAGLDLG